jgi:3-dehydroquinate synthase
MNKILVKLPRANSAQYSIRIIENLPHNLKKLLPAKNSFSSLVIITDHRVKKLYGQTLSQELQQQGYKVLLFSFPAGEKYKNYQSKINLENQMLRQACDRNTLILALGGGVVGDLAGFIAATYMRGIQFIQVPTTLLAMVDSSVGGKTGIDTPYGKNLIGAFWQPQMVIANIHFLQSLSQKHLINGLIEAIKIFITRDAKSFYYVQKNLSDILQKKPKHLQTIIQRAVKLKTKIVQHDEKETHERAVLNFGHTIGHALEKISDYKILHGYAVAYGILLEAKIAQLLGFLAEENYLMIQTLFTRLGIQAKHLAQFNIQKIIQATKLDKKIKAGKVQYVLLKNLGEIVKQQKSVVHPVEDQIVKNAYLAMRSQNYVR